MNKKFRLPVLALSTAVAFSGVIVAPAFVPVFETNVASAQTVNAKEFPSHLVVGEVSEAAPFASAYHIYAEVAKARELMFEAAQKAQFYRTGVPFSWAGRFLAENAYYIAQARLAIVVLQAANFEGARQIDPQLIGIDNEVSAEAGKVLNAAYAHFQGTGANEKAVKDLANAGRTGINGFNAKNNYHETNAFAVIDWGTTEEEKTRANGNYQSLLKNIDVLSVQFDAAQASKHLVAADEATKAAATKERLIAANGPLEVVLESYDDVAKPVNDVAAEAKQIADEADAIAKRINAKTDEVKAVRDKIAAVEAAMIAAAATKDIAVAKAQKEPADNVLAEVKALKAELDTLAAQHAAEAQKKELEAKKLEAEAKKQEAEKVVAAALAKVEGNTSEEALAYKKKVEELKAKIAAEAAKLPSAATVEAVNPIDAALSELLVHAKKLEGEAPAKKGGLSPAAIAGIVAGVLGLVAAIVAAALPVLAKVIPGLARFIPSAP